MKVLTLNQAIFEKPPVIQIRFSPVIYATITNPQNSSQDKSFNHL